MHAYHGYQPTIYNILYMGDMYRQKTELTCITKSRRELYHAKPSGMRASGLQKKSKKKSNWTERIQLYVYVYVKRSIVFVWIEIWKRREDAGDIHHANKVFLPAVSIL